MALLAYKSSWTPRHTSVIVEAHEPCVCQSSAMPDLGIPVRDATLQLRLLSSGLLQALFRGIGQTPGIKPIDRDSSTVLRRDSLGAQEPLHPPPHSLMGKILERRANGTE
ncbi:hypothetical protein HIM_01581 [Hirsutella minnesotensis 3608]|nr:hypothetical protein HIM_01581 [Hirsutella minnesotensis 3608]